jgi:hypothetical protein
MLNISPIRGVCMTNVLLANPDNSLREMEVKITSG